MKIKKIKVTNFKSFDEIEVNLKNFNIFIGANAAGKSNFIDIFKFLRNIAVSGLDNAISMQGGVEYLKNINIGSSKDLSITIVFNKKLRSFKKIKNELIAIETFENIYEFSLKFYKRGNGYKIEKDILTQKLQIFKLKEENKKISNKELLCEAELKIIRKNKKVQVIFKKQKKEVPIKKEDIYPGFLLEEKIPGNMLLLETPYFLIPFPLNDLFEDISIYDFDPKLSKKAISITGKAELEENGSNLSIILKNITENKEKKNKLFNFVKDLLPFISDLDVEKLLDKSLIFKLKEIYFKNKYIPASLISDGTINLTALIVALYFEKKHLQL